MPRINVYIRNEDAALWKKKYSPEWLHKKLHEGESLKPAQADTPPKKIVEVSTRAVCKQHGDTLDARGNCLQKGCKYAK